MAEVLFALARSFASLSRGGVWAAILGPAILALLIWIVLAFAFLGVVIDWLALQPPLSWLSGWGVAWLAHLLAAIGGWVVILAAAYLTAVVIAATVILPLLLRLLARSDYRDVAPLGRDSFIASTVNSLVAVVGYLGGWLVTLPLWLIPGAALVLPIMLLAWLNRRTFAFDALAAHATPAEWQEIKQRHAGSFYLLGLILALAAHVPFLGLFVPSFTALAYVHLGLSLLRGMRGGAVMSGEAEVIEVSGVSVESDGGHGEGRVRVIKGELL